MTGRFFDADGAHRRLLLRFMTCLRIGRDLFPWTPLGLLAMVLGALALWFYGFRQHDFVWMVIGHTLLGLATLSGLMVIIGISFLATMIRRDRQPAGGTERVEAGRPSPTSFRLGGRWWLPLTHFGWDWQHPQRVEVEPRRQGQAFLEWVTVPRRDAFEQVRRSFYVEDVFGFARIRFARAYDVSWEVLPHIGGMANIRTLTSLAGGDALSHPAGEEDGDRIELRRYAPGDPARLLNWKVFARTRKLMVRKPERALTPEIRTAAYLIAHRDDEAAAGVARAAVEQGALGLDWEFSADNALTSTTERQAALTLIARSRQNETGQWKDDPSDAGGSLSSFVDQAFERGPASILVFAPPTAGAWLETVTKVARRYPYRMRVILCHDGIRSTNEGNWLRHALTVTPPTPGALADTASLDEVRSALYALPCECWIVDRMRGVVLERNRRKAAMVGKAA